MMAVWTTDSSLGEHLIDNASRSGCKIFLAQLGAEGMKNVRPATMEEINSGRPVIKAFFNDEPGAPGILDLRSQAAELLTGRGQAPCTPADV